MNKKLLLSLVIALTTISFYAQDPNILWQKTIGGSDEDFMIPAISTNDNGLILGGFSKSDISGEKTENSRGGFDYWIIKLDESGNIEWDKTLGGNQDDFLHTIVQTIDDGYILSGHSKSGISGEKTENSRGDFDYWIIKLDSSGNIEWQKTIGGNGPEVYCSIIQTTDGGFLLGGYSQSNISGEKTENSRGGDDCWILKLNSSGNIEWQKTIGGSGREYLFSMLQTNDNGYILGSTSSSNISGEKTENSRGQTDFWVIKLDNLGNIMWQKTIGGDDTDFLKDIIQTSDGSYMLAGWSYSNISGEKTEDSKGLEDYWILKLNEVGEIMWQKTIGGNLGEQLNRISQISDGGFLLCGWSSSNISGDKSENSNGREDYWIIKIDQNGNLEWQNTIGGDLDDIAGTVFYDNNANNYIAGYSKSNISGDKTENSRGEHDFWIIKHAPTLGLEENPFTETITLYPNPTKNTLKLNTQDKTIDQINIYTMTGSKVLQLDVDTVSPNVDVSTLASGVYYFQLYSGKNVALKKFVKE